MLINIFILEIMILALTTNDGLTPEQGVARILERVTANLRKGNDISQTMTSIVKQHVAAKYPGSKHWNLNKIKEGQSTSGNISSGSTNIEIPGASRAYHDIDIYPKSANHLIIPMHRSAYGLGPAKQNLIYVKTKKGTELLAKKENGNLVWMYSLCKHVHQKQDPSLMPSDGKIAQRIFSHIIKNINTGKLSA